VPSTAAPRIPVKAGDDLRPLAERCIAVERLSRAMMRESSSNELDDELISEFVSVTLGIRGAD
jgi:hypothetical protein